MLDKQLDKLETMINFLEERIDEDVDFFDKDEFYTLYDNLIDLYTLIKDSEIGSFPYRELSKERKEPFLKQLKRFNKLGSRIKIIRDDADIEDGLNTDWMFDKDTEED